MKRLFAPKPALNVEVSEKNVKPRAILAILFLVAGLIAFGFFLFSLLGKQSGWQKIELNAKMPRLSEEITLNYNIGASGFGASAEYKKVAETYTSAATKAYKCLDSYEEYSDVINLCTLSNNPNKEYTVDPVIYKAFELLESYGVRYHYLSDLYMMYEGAFLIETEDYSMAEMDPYKSESAAEYFAEFIAFANSPEHVRVELLGNNKVKLFVSDEYLAFAKQNGVESLVGLGWMQNAFVIDAVAEALIDQGYTQGNLVSINGFNRNLDSSLDYSYNFYAVSGNVIYSAARLDYKGGGSFVAYRDYPNFDTDYKRYYSYADGNIITLYLDPEDGRYKSSSRNMTVFSKDLGVAELAVATAPVFIAEDIDTAKLLALVGNSVTSVWTEGGETVFHTGKGLTVVPTESGGVTFEIKEVITE